MALDMILLATGFFSSIEFYAILVVVAAGIIAWAAKPTASGPVTEHLLASTLIPEQSTTDGDATPSIEILCDDYGNVKLTRRGLAGVTMAGAVSAKVQLKGMSIFVYERIVPGSRPRVSITPSPEVTLTPTDADIDAGAALFSLDFIGQERYFLRYESEALSLSASLTFRNVPGYHAGPVPLKK